MSTVVIGESLVDLVWRAGADSVPLHPGGSPANVARGLHRLGEPVTFITAWGDDVPGEHLGRYLQGTGIPITRAVSETGRTMLALAYISDSTGAATYDFLPCWDPLDLPLGEDVDMLHTGSLAIVVQPGAERVVYAARRLRSRPGATVAVDLNVRPAVQPDRAAYQRAVERLLPVTDVVKASDEDLSWLYPHHSAEQAARALLGFGPRLVALTYGAAGARLITGDHDITATAPRITVVDTIGAGDAFQACLLAELRARKATGVKLTEICADRALLEPMLARCVSAGAGASRRGGAHAPTRHEIQQLLAACDPHEAGAASHTCAAGDEPSSTQGQVTSRPRTRSVS